MKAFFDQLKTEIRQGAQDIKDLFCTTDRQPQNPEPMSGPTVLIVQPDGKVKEEKNPHYKPQK